MSGLLPRLAPEERARFAWAALGFSLVSASGLVFRAMGDTLFLSRFPADLLPPMYVASAVLIVSVSLLLGSLLRRMPLPRLVLFASVALIAIDLLLRLLLVSPHGGFRVAAYLIAELNLQTSAWLFWGLAALAFNAREAKRLFGVMAAGGTLACIVTGFLLRPFAHTFGSENLLVLGAAILGGFALCGLFLSRATGAWRGQTRLALLPAAGKAGYYAGLLRVPQVRNVGLLAVVMTVAMCVVDFQFKTGARALYEGAALAGFIGRFYALANIIGLLVQVLAVHRLLQKGGMLLSLSLLPASILLGSVGSALSPAFARRIVTKSFDPILNFTINTAAFQVLYLGIKNQTRSQARALVDGVSKPLALALAGVGLVAARHILTPSTVALCVVFLCVPWLRLAWRNWASFVAGLAESVSRWRLEGPAEGALACDRETEAVLRRDLREARDEEASSLLQTLPEIGDFDASAEARMLLARESPAVKVAAIEYLASHGDVSNRAAILAHLDHPVVEVRLHATRALGAWGHRPEVSAALARRLDDSEPAVRAAAAVQQMHDGSVEVMLRAERHLREMLRAADPVTRIAAVEELRRLRHEALGGLLGEALADPAANVNRAALSVLESRPLPDLVDPIVALVTHPRLASAAGRALVAAGPAALERLGSRLELDPPPERVLLGCRIASVIGRIGDVRGLPILEPILASPCLDLRAEGIQAYCRLVKLQHSLRPYREVTERVIRREVAAAESLLRIWRNVSAAPGTDLLSTVLLEVQKVHLRNVFAVLNARTRGVDMISLWQGLTHRTSERRDSALDLLDNVLDADLRASLQKLLEPPVSSPENPSGAAKELLRILGGSPPEWVAVGAICAAGERTLEGAVERLKPYLRDRRAVVRETALSSLAALIDRRELADFCATFREDPSPAVRDLARSLAT